MVGGVVDNLGVLQPSLGFHCMFVFYWGIKDETKIWIFYVSPNRGRGVGSLNWMSLVKGTVYVESGTQWIRPPFFLLQSEICLLKIPFNFGLDWGRWSMTIDHWSCCWTPAIHDSFSSSSPWPHHAWAICKTKKKHPKHSISRKSLLIHIGVRNYFQPNQILGEFWENAQKWPKMASFLLFVFFTFSLRSLTDL